MRKIKFQNCFSGKVFLEVNKYNVLLKEFKHLDVGKKLFEDEID